MKNNEEYFSDEDNQDLDDKDALPVEVKSDLRSNSKKKSQNFISTEQTLNENLDETFNNMLLNRIQNLENQVNNLNEQLKWLMDNNTQYIKNRLKNSMSDQDRYIYLLYSSYDDQNDDIKKFKTFLEKQSKNVRDHKSINPGNSKHKELSDLLENATVVICIITEMFVEHAKYKNDITKQLKTVENCHIPIYRIHLELINLEQADSDLRILLNDNKPYKAYENRPRTNPRGELWIGNNFLRFIDDVFVHFKEKSDYSH